MVLPQYARLYASDFPQADQKLVDQMSYTINNGFDSLFQLSQNGINLTDNMAVTVSTVTVTVDSAGTPTSATSFPLKAAVVTPGTPPLGTIVLSANSSGSPAVYPTGGVFVTTTNSQNTVVITNVAGLPANVQYSLTLLTFQS